MFSSKNQEELVIIFDIGSGSVGGAAVLMPAEEGKKPEFIASARFPVLFEADLNPKKFKERMLEALREVGQKIAIARPSKVFCFMASPWLAHQTREVNFKTRTTLVSRKEVREIVGREIESFHRAYLKDYPETAIVESKIQSIVAKKKDAPLEKKLTLFLSVAEDKLTKSIREIVLKTLKTDNVVFNSFLLAQFAVVRNFFDAKNFLLVDVGGEMTEIAKITDDILVESVSFPLGKNNLIRHVAKTAPSLAETLLRLYFDNRLDNKNKTMMDDFLAVEKKHWQNHFENAVFSLTSANLPVFLTVDHDAAEWFIDAISTLTKIHFRCIFLEAKSLMPFCNFKRNLKPDPFLIIEALSLEAHEV